MSRKNPKLVEKLKQEQARQVEVALEPEAMRKLLTSQRLTTAQLCQRTGATESQVMEAIGAAQGRGYLLHQYGEEWGMTKAPAPTSDCPRYESRPDGTYVVGFSSDQHLCSKYERLDVLNDLYDKFASTGVDRVLNGGNWIDGEARFNVHDLKVHGVEAQVTYLVEHFPERKGLTTYTVAGDDHEGWYGQRAGLDIGAFTESQMRLHKREDWVNLGYMEAFIELVHAKTGKSTHLLLMHPGGGSSYADSYRPQKIVESLAGGEKPAALFIAHYHKLGYYPIRNVHCIQTGTCQDQTPFMRKKGIQAHVGGGICELRQDEATGAIIGCKVEFFTYYNEGYYNNRWSHGGDVNLPYRGI